MGIGGFIRRTRWRLRGVSVFGLSGRSGTGKSFRARLVMEKHNIDLLVDDGLLIRDKVILAGRSAKREKSYMAAVKCALFEEQHHLDEVLAALARTRFRSVLVLGTSDRMVERIANRLRLPAPSRIIHIEDISTEEEIAAATRSRGKHGRHVIPVPVVEVRRRHRNLKADSVLVRFRRPWGLLRKHSAWEKSIVRPEFGGDGDVQISQAALGQMITHCVREFHQGLNVLKITIRPDREGYSIDLELSVSFGADLAAPLHQLRRYISESIERHAGIVVHEVNVLVNAVEGPQQEGSHSRPERG